LKSSGSELITTSMTPIEIIQRCDYRVGVRRLQAVDNRVAPSYHLPPLP